MSASDIQILIGSVIGLIAALAGGCKWLLMHIEANQVKANLAEEKARSELSTRLYAEISALRQELLVSRAETTASHKENKLYLRRIFQLEAFIHTQKGVQAPQMDGWPPL